MFLSSRRAAILSKSGSSLTFCSAVLMTASSSCSVVIPSNNVSCSSYYTLTTLLIWSGSPSLASTKARLIMLASNGARVPSRFTTDMLIYSPVTCYFYWFHTASRLVSQFSVFDNARRCPIHRIWRWFPSVLQNVCFC